MLRPLRILHFLPVYAPAWQYGGPVQSVSRLCEALARHGSGLELEVEVITTNAGLPDFPVESLALPQWRHGVRVTYYPEDKPGGSIRSRALCAALPRHLARADLLHLSGVWQPLAQPVQRQALRAQVPVVHSLRGALGPYSMRRGWWKKWPYYWLIERPLLQQVAALHCTTAQEVDELRGLGLRAHRWLLPNSIDLSAFYPDPEVGQQWRTSQGLDPDRPLLVVAGRLHHKKGLDLLPPVLKRLADLPWQLAVIGGDDDGSGARLRLQLDHAGLGGRCRWLPSLPADQLRFPFSAADLLLLPSRHENFGNVVVEALACGAAVMLSDQVGVQADINDLAGVFVVPRSREAWLKALESWLHSPQRAGSAVAAVVAERFSAPTLAAQAYATYQQIVTRGTP